MTMSVAVLAFPLAARPWGGISWATFRLVEHITRLYPEDRFHLVFTDDNPNEFGSSKVDKLVEERDNLSTILVVKGRDAAGWCEANADVVWGPASGILGTSKVSQVFTHHDMRMFGKLRESYVNYLKHKTGLDRAMKRAKAAVMISPTTMRDTLERYKGPRYANKTCYIPWGVPGGFDDGAKIEPKRPSFIEGHEFMTTIYDPFPHKRMDLLERVLPLLDEHKWDLVVIGSMRGGGIDITIDHPRVHYPGFVSDELLPRYIKASSLYLHPSEYEGYGHPPYEAMTLDVPVLYNRSCDALATLMGDTTWSFEGDEDLGHVLGRLMASEEERRRHVEAAREWVKVFDWRTTAHRYMYLFRMAKRYKGRDLDFNTNDPEPPTEVVTP